MKNITFALAGLGLLVAGSAQAANLGHFGPYAKANDNQVVSAGEQVVVPAEGRLNAYAPAEEVATGDTQIAISPEGRLSAYRS